MNNNCKPEEFITPPIRDFITLTSDIEFIQDSDSLIIISPSGYKRVISKLILRIHEKIYPLILKGCSETQLLSQIPKEATPMVRNYLRILKDLQAFNRSKDIDYDKKNTLELLDGKDIENLFRRYGKPESELEKHFFSLGTVINGKKTVTVICSLQNFFSLFKELTNNIIHKQISILLIPHLLKSEYPLAEMIDWHLGSEPFLIRKVRSVAFFNLNFRGLRDKLLYQKLNVDQLSFRDLIDNLSFTFPLRNLSQLPLSLVTYSAEDFEIPYIMIGLNYKSISASLLIREIVRQSVFTEGLNISNQPELYLRHFHDKTNIDFISSASRLEIKGWLLDKFANRLFSPSSKAKQVDVLSIQSLNPSINYLQDILRLKFPSLIVNSEICENVFYLFSDENNCFISISEEKALYDYLLQKTFNAYYSYSDLEEKRIEFHSNLLSFGGRKTIARKIKNAEIFVRRHFQNFHNFKFPISKVETYWGDYYYTTEF